MTKLPCVWNLCSVAILLLILGEANGFLVTSHTGRWKASNIPLTRRSRPSGLKTKMSAFNEDVDAVVVGGGVSGLSAAFYLKKGGARVLLSEKSTRAGGNIETRKDQAGYIFEDGPNTFNPTQPMLEWISDLGLSEKLVVCDPKLPRYVFHANELFSLPSGGGPPKDLFRLLSPIGIAQAALGALLPLSPAPEEKASTLFCINPCTSFSLSGIHLSARACT